jgi:general secretion pathway protein F
MKLDEFAFVNRQLAGMLRSGLPLEGALRQVCQSMRQGRLQTELKALEADLAQGVSLRDALARRRLPEFYARLLHVGAAGGDLPGVLTLLADYYQRASDAWTRLQGLMVYPAIVLATALALSVGLSVLLGRLAEDHALLLTQMVPGARSALAGMAVLFWLPAVFLALVALAFALVLLVPSWRRALRWRLPAFKEASLSQLAGAAALLLRHGGTARDTLGFLRHLEAGSPVDPELARWESRLAAGGKQFPELAAGGRLVPPLFVWLVASSGEDWAAGFKQAAELYHERAMHRLDQLLFAALPVSVVGLGALILCQVLPVAAVFTRMMNMLGDVNGFGD